eukprot:scaffold89323_cov72-Phaeocystis_antarctica.AAC.2
MLDSILFSSPPKEEPLHAALSAARSWPQPRVEMACGCPRATRAARRRASGTSSMPTGCDPAPAHLRHVRLIPRPTHLVARLSVQAYRGPVTKETLHFLYSTKAITPNTYAFSEEHSANRAWTRIRKMPELSEELERPLPSQAPAPSNVVEEGSLSRVDGNRNPATSGSGSTNGAQASAPVAPLGRGERHAPPAGHAPLAADSPMVATPRADVQMAPQSMQAQEGVKLSHLFSNATAAKPKGGGFFKKKPGKWHFGQPIGGLALDADDALGQQWPRDRGHLPRVSRHLAAQGDPRALRVRQAQGDTRHGERGAPGQALVPRAAPEYIRARAQRHRRRHAADRRAVCRALQQAARAQQDGGALAARPDCRPVPARVGQPDDRAGAVHCLRAQPGQPARQHGPNAASRAQQESQGVSRTALPGAQCLRGEQVRGVSCQGGHGVRVPGVFGPGGGGARQTEGDETAELLQHANGRRQQILPYRNMCEQGNLARLDQCVVVGR